MLVLSRKIGQHIFIGPDIVVTVVRCRDGSARIGIQAPQDVQILRGDAKKTDGPQKP